MIADKLSIKVFVKRMIDELVEEMDSIDKKIGHVCFQNHLEDEEYYYIECF